MDGLILYLNSKRLAITYKKSDLLQKKKNKLKKRIMI